MHMVTPLHRCLRQVAIWMLAATCALLAPAVLAGDLQVSPISLEFSPTEQAQGLWLSNTGTATLTTTFAGTDPNGAWSLYIMDDAGGDDGVITGGWSIAVTTSGQRQRRRGDTGAISPR